MTMLDQSTIHEHEKPGTFTYVASTGEVDRAGDIVDPAGWELERYRKNPVVLFMHNWHLPPIGKAERVWIEPGHPGTPGSPNTGRLMATIRYADTALGQEIARLNAGGYMAAVSVGFKPLNWEPRFDKGTPVGLHCHRQELLEISAVPVPANASALRTKHESRLAGAANRPDGSLWLLELDNSYPIEHRPNLQLPWDALAIKALRELMQHIK